MSPPTLSPSVVNSLSSSPDWESWSSTLLNCRRSSACSELRGKMKPMWTGANLNWGRGGSRAPQFSYYTLHRFYVFITAQYRSISKGTTLLSVQLAVGAGPNLC